MSSGWWVWGWEGWPVDVSTNRLFAFDGFSYERWKEVGEFGKGIIIGRLLLTCYVVI